MESQPLEPASVSEMLVLVYVVPFQVVLSQALRLTVLVSSGSTVRVVLNVESQPALVVRWLKCTVLAVAVLPS